MRPKAYQVMQAIAHWRQHCRSDTRLGHFGILQTGPYSPEHDLNLRRLHLGAYDIATDSRRSRCARLLLDHGLRCQKSVFELPLALADIPSLLQMGERIINPETDRLLLLPVSAGAEVEGLGRGVSERRTDLFVVN